MQDVVFAAGAGVLLLAWIAAETRFGALTRIAVGLALAAVLAAGWIVAEWSMGRQDRMHEERYRWIRFYAELGDTQKVMRLASPSSEAKEVRIWEEEDEIVRQIRALGGWATPCEGLDPTACVFVDLARNFSAETEVTESVLQRLGQLPRIGRLDLDGTAIQDSWLEHVGKLTQLQYLSLDNTKITDVGLEHLKGMTRLVFLGLHGTKVTDDGLGKLRSLGQVEYLDLSETGVTEEGVKRLQEALPNCDIDR